jgi:hypothetical protein
MTKMRVLLLSVVAACAFGAVVATAAQAHEYLIEGKPFSGEAKLEEKTETETKNVLKGVPFGVSTEIQCSERKFGGGLLGGSPGDSTAKITFTGCTATKPANCTPSQPIVTDVDGVLEGVEGALETKFSPPEGSSVFTEITLEGAKCSLKGKPFKIEGTQNCELPGAETSLVEHELSCKATKSALKAGGKTASFESDGAKLRLLSGDPFSAG